MHLHAGEVHLQYFMPRQDATDRPDSAACTPSPTTAAAMWEYHQQARTAPLHPSPTSSFPASWSPYAGTTAALLDGSTFAADSEAAGMRLPVSEHIDHGHAWISRGELSNSTGYRENFLDLLSTKNVTPDMFDEVPGAGHYAAPGAMASRFEAAAGSEVSSTKYEIAGSPLFLGSGPTDAALQAQQGMDMMSCMPRYADHHQMKEESSNHHQQQHQHELANPMASFLQQISIRTTTGGVMHPSLDYSGLGGLDKICHEGRAMEAAGSFSMASLTDFGNFGGYRSTTESSVTTSVQPYMRRADLSTDSSRQEQEIVSARSNSSGGSGTASERKKRPSEERKEGAAAKKSKQEASTSSPPKQQVPKVKLGEKITSLQQIVSPFGKTDTASVLFETIKYIKFLHEQVQLLSEPYTNASRSKGIVSSNVVPWGGNAEALSKGGGEGEHHDLKDRGLCLVPVSWTPEVYRDGNAMDYWTPAYRGCLYR